MLDKSFLIERFVKHLLERFPVLPDPYDKRDYRYAESVLAKEPIPQHADFSKYQSLARNQGSVGKCVSFSTVAPCEGLINQSAGRELMGLEQSDLSEQFVYNMCKLIDGHAGEGTFLRCGYKVWNKYGIPTEQLVPYKENLVRENYTDDVFQEAATRKLKEYLSIGRKEEEFLSALSTGPVSIVLPIYRGIYKAVHVPMPERWEQSLGLHAMVAVGYDLNGQWTKTEDRKAKRNLKMIKVKNSWGWMFGDCGYQYFPLEYFVKNLVSAWKPIGLIDGQND